MVKNIPHAGELEAFGFTRAEDSEFRGNARHVEHASYIHIYIYMYVRTYLAQHILHDIACS